MSSSANTVTANQRNWKIITLEKGNSKISVVPEAGFSIISFQWKTQELLDQWDINAFLGDSDKINFITQNITDSFRKGFGPSMGPWFNTKTKTTKDWQHGVCRYAEWKDIEIGDDYIKGRLDGSKDTLLSQTLNQIVGFSFAVEITYRLTEHGLDYEIKNLSEQNKGTFGIHWYWKSYPNTIMNLKADTNQIPENLTENRYTINDHEVIADLNIRNGDIFQNLNLGLETQRGFIRYPNGSQINFYYSDNFAITVLFNTKDGCCFEPVSGMPHQVGTFTKGVIRIHPEGF